MDRIYPIEKVTVFGDREIPSFMDNSDNSENMFESVDELVEYLWLTSWKTKVLTKEEALKIYPEYPNNP